VGVREFLPCITRPLPKGRAGTIVESTTQRLSYMSAAYVWFRLRRRYSRRSLNLQLPRRSRECLHHDGTDTAPLPIILRNHAFLNGPSIHVLLQMFVPAPPTSRYLTRMFDQDKPPQSHGGDLGLCGHHQANSILDVTWTKCQPPHRWRWAPAIFLVMEQQPASRCRGARASPRGNKPYKQRQETKCHCGKQMGARSKYPDSSQMANEGCLSW
jgi:hypothetical protein